MQIDRPVDKQSETGRQTGMQANTNRHSGNIFRSRLSFHRLLTMIRPWLILHKVFGGEVHLSGRGAACRAGKGIQRKALSALLT